MTSSTLVADPTFQVRHSYDSEAGQLVTKLKTRDKTPVAQRPTEAFREFWVQQYVAANFRRLGFDGCEGPFESGPDFRLHKTGRWRAVEVETFATNYLKHKHHLDARWNDAEHLIVLEDDLGDGNPRVPDVMVIDRAHFTSWCSTAMKDYALRRQEERPSFVVETQLHEAGQVFRSLALETCSSKRREMAACPDCNRCPYFGDGDADGGVADRYFFRLTASFLEVARGRVSFAAMIRFFDDHYDWSLTGFEFEP